VDAATASVAVAGLATVAVAVIKFVPTRQPKSRHGSNGVAYCDKIGPVEGAIDTLRALSEERQQEIVRRLERIEQKLDNR